MHTVRRMNGQLPWEPVAHAALAVASQAEGDDATAADESRAALDVDGDTHLSLYLPILWAAARTLIRPGEPEAAALTAEILAGLSYLNMSMTDPEIRAKWLDVPIHRELAEIVGFDPSQVLEPGELEAVDLSHSDLELLRGLASGSVTAAAGSAERTGEDPNEVSRLLAKMGVATQNEAIEFAIKAGVTWR